MYALTNEELKKWKEDMFKLCEQLKGKTDNVSNAMRITAVEMIGQIRRELIRRGAPL